jgi:alkanesulfonate monooxygenase SsuD/methylene tetrahydromethanopterin reductase-like flavin-dependent oxidoreductase (luciferase family)
MRLGLMVEGQEGVTWDDWRSLAALAEELGFDALMRSDHYLSVAGQSERGALDAWGTICALGPLTQRIRLGTLVSPVTFRPAAILAKLALTADHTSGGRIDVGMGTGWWQAEHETFGLAFPPMAERFALLERQVADVTRLWAQTRPEPVQRPRPRLILGGQAKPRAAALAARYADEYNLLYCTAEQVREKRAALDARLALSMMTGFAIGADRAEVDGRLDRIEAHIGHRGNETWLIGTPEEVLDQIRALEAAGLDRIMLQHHLHRDDGALRLIADTVLPALAG